MLNENLCSLRHFEYHSNMSLSRFRLGLIVYKHPSSFDCPGGESSTIHLEFLLTALCDVSLSLIPIRQNSSHKPPAPPFGRGRARLRDVGVGADAGHARPAHGHRQER